MKKIVIAAALIVSGLLVGCNQLTQYTVSEQEINQALEIFLQEMEIVDAVVTPDKMKPVLQTLMPYLNQSLQNYFNQQPAYVLSEDKSKGESLAKKYAKGIEVKPGEIIIPFTD